MQPLVGQDHIPSPSPEAPDPLADSLVILHTSRRFRAGSGIDALSRAVNSGDPEVLERVLHQDAPDLHSMDGSGSVLRTWLRAQLEALFLPLFTADSPLAALRELDRCRILCALREGPDGVEGINRLVETLFRRQGSIPPAERVYRGLPILILRNDYGLGLFNGDTGILWPDEQGTLQAWFSGDKGAIRPVGLARLPAWQTSYAITVHKSQGSEFAQVLFILPQDDVPILSRELLYTGITRAREHLTLVGRRDLLLRAIQRRVIRYSGLGDRLRRMESSLATENPH
jgi:exodeoxyribonuclease V alpha subunit